MLYTLDQLHQEITTYPEQWRPLVFTNGCFDLLHVGHVRYLQTAKTFGKRLVIGLNSDSSVRQLKPPKMGYPPRPLTCEDQRAEVLAALKPVDAVVIFPEQTASTLIETLKPDIYVKGGDYTPETLPEYPQVVAYGGRVELVKVEIPSSTTGMVERILQNKSLQECDKI
ncbi:D-glycero-beta-D-manno-heptose 1-phosphate adenylyltransferase [Spirulina sp. CS-785/01]|uniref:D-glycero-beta-D-manno-heptose 1-phosphate adenylyltransferase n=1 Tax=Spirulina sp. CS-785/01 TaxID=3021716 RepID=UPI00232EA9B4|nr:D-glycero-beta-D-manno-heptose 1-phosphate adenylyltransferase [Spirulina sp. CS-785/01]MDB9312136.1 D-glycero-beta-D-manno-heptose 1-phosphate adenylyltransferase [Spirulina sp. CS-785/01]